MKIGLFQYSPVWGNAEESTNKIDKILTDIHSVPDLIIFPEMSLTGFSMDSEHTSETTDGKSVNYFRNLAAKLQTNIIAGIPIKENENYYNSLFYFDREGTILSRYDKIHLFSMAEEHLHFSPGTKNITTKIDEVSAGLSVCYDLRFPEFYRYYGKQKIQLIINIASWPIKRIEHWKALLRARAIENLCFVAAVNRTGEDIYHQYNGCSCIFDPMGNTLMMIEDEEGLFVADIDPSFADHIKTKLNFIDDIKLI